MRPFVEMISKIDQSAIRVTFATYQIIQSVQWSVGIPFPSVFQAFLRILSLLSFDFLSPQCFTNSNSYYITTLIWSFGPIFLTLLNFLVFIARVFFNGEERKGGEPRLVREHFGFFLILSFVVLPPVSLKQFQALDCVPVAGANYVRVNTAVNVR